MSGGTGQRLRRATLEIIALGPDDAVAAEKGGADRLEVVTDMAADGLSPTAQTVAAIRRHTTLPIRVMLRLRSGFEATPDDLDRLAELGSEYLRAGADGFVLGFLTPSLEVDAEAVHRLLTAIDSDGEPPPWTFHRAVDHVLDSDKAWRALLELPRMDAVLTAGSARGAGDGADELVHRARYDPRTLQLMMVGGGLVAEQVPWLAQAGVRAFHVGSSVRPDRSWKAYVDAAYVRAWRTLLDEETARAADVGPAAPLV